MPLREKRLSRCPDFCCKPCYLFTVAPVFSYVSISDNPAMAGDENIMCYLCEDYIAFILEANCESCERILPVSELDEDGDCDAHRRQKRHQEAIDRAYVHGEIDEVSFYEMGDYDMCFSDPGGRSALRSATCGTCPSCRKEIDEMDAFCRFCGLKQNPRNLPCPSCGEENRLTLADRARGYQCDRCADRAEGLTWQY